MRTTFFLVATLIACALPMAPMAADAIKVDVIKNPYGGARNVPELSTNPDYIHAAGLERLIGEWGGELIRPVQDVRLKPEQENSYGEWNRMALANANFADMVREGLQDNMITVGLEANCNDLLGMLSGLKYDSDGNTRRVGLVFMTPTATSTHRRRRCPACSAACRLPWRQVMRCTTCVVRLASWNRCR